MKLPLLRMAMPVPITFSLCSLIAYMVLFLTQNPILTDSKTLESDIEVLQSLKQSVDPNSISSTSFISTWNFGVDPCDAQGAYFLGILCTIPEDNSSSRIAAINLEGDRLEGFLSPILGNLTELTLLNLRKNKFRGPIPDSIISMRKVTTLLLSENYLSGHIPYGISALKRLEIMDLSDNSLTGSIPAAISNLRRLSHLRLSKNEFSGRIPDLTGLWQLNTLDLSGNQLSGSLPEFPSNLRTLLVGHNLLFGHISTINRLCHLTALDLSDNRFSGLINRGIFTLPEVTHINVSANRFTELEVSKMSNRPSQLQAIEAQNNRIRGRLPLNLVTYGNLTAVNLGHNMFFGEIPAEYGEMVGRGCWKSLFLDYNLLEGSVPSGFTHSSIRGSLAHNCVICSRNIPMCRGGQRPASACVRRR